MKLQDLQEDLQQERRSREDERRTQYEERRRKEEEIHHQATVHLSRAKAEIELMTEKNAELQEEVCTWYCLAMDVAQVSQFGLQMNMKSRKCVSENKDTVFALTSHIACSVCSCALSIHTELDYINEVHIYVSLITVEGSE